MVDEQQPDLEQSTDGEAESDASGGPERLTQAVRRERLEALAERIGERAVLDGERIVVEVEEPVILHFELDRDGEYTATWWATALTENAHHRWREAAGPLLVEGESIHTSALGGGYLVEVERTTHDESDVLAWASGTDPVERVNELLKRFPEEVGKLSPEPVPDYLLPPEPELPPLGEVDSDEAEPED